MAYGDVDVGLPQRRTHDFRHLGHSLITSNCLIDGFARSDDLFNWYFSSDRSKILSKEFHALLPGLINVIIEVRMCQSLNNK